MSGVGWHREGFLALKRAGAPSRPRPRLSRVVTPCPPCAPAPLQLPGQGVLRPTPPLHTAGGGRAAPSSCPSSCPPACLPEPPGTCPAPPGLGVSPGLGSRPAGAGTCSSGDGRGDRARQLRGWQRGQHRAPGPSRVVSHPGAAPSCAQERECWECWDAAGAGSVSLAARGGERGRGHTAPSGQEAPRALSCVLLGSLSWLGQSLPPGWLSRGAYSLREVPSAAASWMPLCPLLEGGDQTSPGMRVPSG